MGNAPAKIGVRLHDDVVEAGHVLKGRVYLNIQGRTPQKARGIHLVLVGMEQSEIAVEKKSDNHGETRRHVHTASETLVHIEVPLMTFDSGSVNSGQYEYPFEWPLPENLPSSMNCRAGDSYCSIHYKLTAYLDQSRGILPDYSSTVDIMIAAASKVERPVPLEMEAEKFPITACCSDRGTMTLGWDADTIVAAPKGVMNVGIMGRNDSIVRLDSLRVRVIETVTWSSHGHTRKQKRELVSTKIDATENVHWRALKGLPSRQERRRMRYTAVDNSELLDNRALTQLQLPLGVLDTYHGSLVDIRHVLIVSAETSGCCISSPESSVSISIQRRMPKLEVQATPQASAPPMYQDDEIVAVAHATMMTEDYNSSYNNPPMAVAEILPPDWSPHQCDVVIISTADIVPSVHDSDVMPSAPQETLLRESHQIASSLAALQTTLRSSKNKNSLQILQDQLQNPTMVATVENLSPHEFVETLKVCRCRDADDYARHARVLASTMVPNFYCRHVLACLWGLPQSVRFQVLKEIAPLASDISTQRTAVERELDPHELLQFQAALS